jgi:hypothetical protein
MGPENYANKPANEKAGRRTKKNKYFFSPQYPLKGKAIPYNSSWRPIRYVSC